MLQKSETFSKVSLFFKLISAKFSLRIINTVGVSNIGEKYKKASLKGGEGCRPPKHDKWYKRKREKIHTVKVACRHQRNREKGTKKLKSAI
jgi:hypothetical protein